MSLFKNTKFILLLLLVIGCILRFYNLTFGSPYYFHPDERNIVNAVTTLHFPDKLDPHFYAYGSLPIYAIYLLGVLSNFISSFVTHVSLDTATIVPFEQALVISRIFSAIFSTLLIFLIYKIGENIGNKKTGILGATLATFSVGLIQFAHFGTFEMWLTFFSTLLFYYCLILSEKGTLKAVVKTAGILSILIAIKISSIALLPLPILALALYLLREKSVSVRKRILKGVGEICLLIVTTTVFSLLLTPFLFLNNKDFMGSMQYETSVAIGVEPVFYTGEFYTAQPVIFQFLHVYPFLLNPFLTVICILSFIYVLYLALKQKNTALLILTFFFLILFFSQAFLFVKWTRYIVPTLPFIYILIAKSIEALHQKGIVGKTILLSGIFLSMLFSLCFEIAVYTHPFTTVEANAWAGTHIPKSAHILSEEYDLGIIAFNSQFPHITLFNFYDLETNSLEDNNLYLPTLVQENQYIILPSQRIEKVRLMNPHKFPIGNKFYNALFNGTLGFKKIYETPCDIFCKITYLGDPVNSFEETATVFDRPAVFIFKKQKNLTEQEYQQLL